MKKKITFSLLMSFKSFFLRSVNVNEIKDNDKNNKDILNYYEC